LETTQERLTTGKTAKQWNAAFKIMEKILYVTFRDNGPDNEGRRHFLLEWESNHIGYFKNETGLFGQIFFTQPEKEIYSFIKKDYEIKYKNS